jgi:hypothetical protein
VAFLAILSGTSSLGFCILSLPLLPSPPLCYRV